MGIVENVWSTLVVAPIVSSLLSLGNKCKHDVYKEIPNRYAPNCKKLCKIEIHLKPSIQNINHKRTNAQSQQRNQNESHIFFPYVGIMAVKCPDSVQIIITRSRHCKSNGVGQILLGFEIFFSQIRKTKVNKYTTKSNNPKLNELQEKWFCKKRNHKIKVCNWKTYN
jgi:hypothetical protein